MREHGGGAHGANTGRRETNTRSERRDNGERRGEKIHRGDREKHNVRKGESEWERREGFEKENARNKLEKETTLARSMNEREKGTRSGRAGNRWQEGGKGQESP